MLRISESATQPVALRLNVLHGLLAAPHSAPRPAGWHKVLGPHSLRRCASMCCTVARGNKPCKALQPAALRLNVIHNLLEALQARQLEAGAILQEHHNICARGNGI